MNGCPVRSRASEQPVHSALCRYTTEGRRGMVSARATCSANPVPMPIVTATMLQNFRKSRRDTPCRSSRASTFSFPRPTAIRIRFSLFSGRQDVGHMRGSKWSEPLPHPLGVSSVKTTKPGRCPCDCGRNAAHCRARLRSVPQGKHFSPSGRTMPPSSTSEQPSIRVFEGYGNDRAVSIGFSENRNVKKSA